MIGGLIRINFKKTFWSYRNCLLLLTDFQSLKGLRDFFCEVDFCGIFVNITAVLSNN